ncbi:hypothetical protein [Pseudomonas asplenii]|uniref:hypothetical protein n=1 Tax=Pseudomonas asplenii TaxID=53407 RepID=UPI000380E7EF|nr:hypothetical protein [Pseudomonas fuscovaginae]
MLTFLSPRERRLARLLKPKAAFWHWMMRGRRALGMQIERNNHLEKALNQSFDHFGFFPAAGFVFDDGCYKLQLQDKDGSFVEHQCESLLEVATIVSIKTGCWTEQTASYVPDYARVALESASPADFISRYKKFLRDRQLQSIRQCWIFWLTNCFEETDKTSWRVKCLASVLFEEYEFAAKHADAITARQGNWDDLGINLISETESLLKSIRGHLFSVLRLENPYAFHLYPACKSFEEVYRLLSGDSGFLRGRIAMMTNAQRDHMFSEDLGL